MATLPTEPTPADRERGIYSYETLPGDEGYQPPAGATAYRYENYQPHAYAEVQDPVAPSYTVAEAPKASQELAVREEWTPTTTLLGRTRKYSDQQLAHAHALAWTAIFASMFYLPVGAVLGLISGVNLGVYYVKARRTAPYMQPGEHFLHRKFYYTLVLLAVLLAILL